MMMIMLEGKCQPSEQHRPAQSVGRTPLERSNQKKLLQGGQCGEQLSFRKRMMLFSLTMTHMMMMMMRRRRIRTMSRWPTSIMSALPLSPPQLSFPFTPPAQIWSSPIVALNGFVFFRFCIFLFLVVTYPQPLEYLFAIILVVDGNLDKEDNVGAGGVE